MKQWQSFLLVFVLVAFVSIYTGRDSLAFFAWQKYGWADAALVLNRHDASLATRIGNHFFNADKEGVYDLALAKRPLRIRKYVISLPPISTPWW